MYKSHNRGKFNNNNNNKDVGLYRVGLRMYSSSLSAPTATSPVEELPRIFSRQSKVAWNTAQELYDVGYVIYKAEGRREDRRRKRRGTEKTVQEVWVRMDDRC